MSVLFPLRLSLQVAAIATVFVLIIGIPVPTCSPGSASGERIINLVLTLPMVLPPVVTGYVLLLVFGNNGLLGKAFYALTGGQFGIVFTWHAAVIASFAVSFPFLIVTARAAMEGIDQDLSTLPTCWAGPSSRRWRVVVPLAGRGIIAGATLLSHGPWASSAPRSCWPETSRARPTPCPSPSTRRPCTDPGAALWMVLLFVFVAAAVMYLSNRLGRKAVKAESSEARPVADASRWVPLSYNLHLISVA